MILPYGRFFCGEKQMTNRMITVDPDRILGCGYSGSVFSDGIEDASSKELYVFPGFCDVHVHFREPGFS